MVAEHALIGRKIIRVEFLSGCAKNHLVLKLDDGSTLTITEGSGPGADANWYTYPEITLQKDGEVLDQWRL